MSLALQANKMGLNTRAMGGIDLDAATKPPEFLAISLKSYVLLPLVQPEPMAILSRI
jgi:hypothetical protein